MNTNKETGCPKHPELMNAEFAKSISSSVTKEHKLWEELSRLNEHIQDAARAGNFYCYYSVEHEDIKKEFLKAVKELGYTIVYSDPDSDLLGIRWK